MRILLVGGHQKTKSLVKSLKGKHHSIVVINEDYEWCQLLSNAYDIICVHGDGTKPFILEDADTATMDAVIALGNRDAENLVVCEIAKKQFKVKNTIAIVNEPRNMEVFKKLGVDKCISATQMIADIIESEAVFTDIQEYLPLEHGRIACLEITLTDKSPAIGVPISRIGMTDGSIIGCVLRGEQTIIPKGDTVLMAGDKLVVLAAQNVVDRAGALFSGQPQ
jgi:trk system potassium uptake protein TrkA